MSMLNPEAFLKTVYLGDRGCKAIQIDGWKEQVLIEVNQISRIRNSSGQWDFYSDEDIVNGRIVFTGVKSVQLSPPGPLPNDLINGITATPAVTGVSRGTWTFEASINSIASDGKCIEVKLRIIASDVHLEDPART